MLLKLSAATGAAISTVLGAVVLTIFWSERVIRRREDRLEFGDEYDDTEYEIDDMMTWNWG